MYFFFNWLNTFSSLLTCLPQVFPLSHHIFPLAFMYFQGYDFNFCNYWHSIMWRLCNLLFYTMFYCVKSVINLSIWKLNTVCNVWLNYWSSEFTPGLLWWVGSCHQVNPYTITHSSFPVGWWRDLEQKQENSCQDEDILIQEAKLCAQVKHNMNFFFLAAGRCFQQDDKPHNPDYPSFLFSLSFYC